MCNQCVFLFDKIITVHLVARFRSTIARNYRNMEDDTRDTQSVSLRGSILAGFVCQ